MADASTKNVLVVSLCFIVVFLTCFSTVSCTSSTIKVSSLIQSSDEQPAKQGNYLVSVGIGTPQRNLSLIIDLASTLSTWASCESAIKSSSSYRNDSCTSPACKQLQKVDGFLIADCEDKKCAFATRSEGDTTWFNGFLVSVKLRVSGSTFDNFHLGCFFNNQGASDGTLGLKGDEGGISFISQTEKDYGKSFSYCLPTASAIGHLTFGKKTTDHSFQYTSLTLDANERRYALNIKSLQMDHPKLVFNPILINSPYTIIDTRTVITRLPPATYLELRTYFRLSMSDYPLTQPLDILDTCYDLSSFEEVEVPTIRLTLGGRVAITLDETHLLYIASDAKVCLAFAPTTEVNAPAVLGTHQQKNIRMYFDLYNGLLGFAPQECT